MSLDGPKTRLGDDFGCTSGCLEPRNSWDIGRRDGGGFFFPSEEVYEGPIHNYSSL